MLFFSRPIGDNKKILHLMVIQLLFLGFMVTTVLRYTSSLLKKSIEGCTDSSHSVFTQASTESPGSNFKELRAYSSVEDTRQCGVAVGLGSDLHGERGQFALINSIIHNYYDHSRVLCVFSFSGAKEIEAHADHIGCIFDELPANVRIIVSVIDSKENWSPRIFSENGSGRAELNSEYNWFRWYLKPENVQGIKKLIWLDTDTIVQGNVAELYDWDLKGHIVAAASYPQPMKKSLCFDPNKGWNPVLGEMEMHYHGKMYRPQNLPHHMNAGVLLIDLEKMAKKGVLKEWHRLLQIHEDPKSDCVWKLSNQPPFTLAIRNSYEELPDEWNIGCMGCVSALRLYKGDACAEGKILHWNGSLKPWVDMTHVDSSTGTHETAGCREHWQKYDILTNTKNVCGREKS